MIARYWSAQTTQQHAPDYANHLETSISHQPFDSNLDAQVCLQS